MYRTLPSTAHAANTYSSVTVDIFDTVLLRKIWPEDLQFLKVAEQWTHLFKSHLKIETTPYEIYTYRRDSRRILKFAKTLVAQKHDPEDSLDNLLDHDEVGVEEWFSFIIDTICDSYNIKIGDSAKSTLIKLMIATELDIEKENLVLNAKLINYLRIIKKQNKDISIIFVSDMYLNSRYIYKLLKHYGVAELFSYGISSCDYKKAKWSGRVYQHLNNKHLRIGENLHIGDNHHSDVKIAQLFGSDSVHYNPLRNIFFRRFMNKAGQLKLRRIIKKKRIEIRLAYMKNFQNQNSTNKHKVSRISRRIGYVFGFPLYAYLAEMSWLSAAANTKMISVSSEALTFKKYIAKVSPTLYSKSRFSFVPKLNRRKALLVLLDNIVRSDLKKLSLRVLINTLRLGERLDQNRSMYQFVTGKGVSGGPDVILDHLDSKEMGKLITGFLDSTTTKELAAARKEYRQFLKAVDEQNSIILDVGWNGTIQALLQQSLLVNKINSKLHGIYMGHRLYNHVSHLQKGLSTGWLFRDIACELDYKVFVPEIWEYVYTQKNHGTGLQDLIKNGLDTSIDFCSTKTLNASPMEIYYACRPVLVNLLSRPSKECVELLGQIKFDSGFATTSFIPLVNTDKPRYRIILKILLRPKKFVTDITRQYSWTAGYINYYRVGLAARPLLRLAGKLNKRRLI